MRLRTLLAFALLLFCFNPVGAAQTADNQRTKIAIVGLVHSHCWGFVTKLNQMHQNQDLIEIVGVSDDNQELRDYVKTLVPAFPSMTINRSCWTKRNLEAVGYSAKTIGIWKSRKASPRRRITFCLKSPWRR